MKTPSVLARFCLASLPAFALTLGAAEGERRDNADRPSEQREPGEPRERRREAGPEPSAAPRDGERAGPRDQARPAAPGARRPGAESAGPQGSRHDGPGGRDGERRSPGPGIANERPADAPRHDGHMQAPMHHAPNAAAQPEEKLRHVREAIEHLHLAGLHEAAERLARDLPPAPGAPAHGRRLASLPEGGAGPRGIRPQFQPPGGEGPQGRSFTPPTAGNSPNEMRELHEELAQLKRMVEELARQRR